MMLLLLLPLPQALDFLQSIRSSQAEHARLALEKSAKHNALVSEKQARLLSAQARSQWIREGEERGEGSTALLPLHSCTLAMQELFARNSGLAEGAVKALSAATEDHTRQAARTAQAGTACASRLRDAKAKLQRAAKELEDAKRTAQMGRGAAELVASLEASVADLTRTAKVGGEWGGGW